MASGDAQAFKVVLVGDAKVGKTSVLTQWARSEYLEYYEPTVSPELTTKRMTIQGQEAVLSVWDIGFGEPETVAQFPSFAKGAAGVLLMYDLSDASSVDALDHWLKEVRTLTGANTVFVIVGTKSDRGTAQGVAQKARNLCDSFGMKHVETSAQDSSNITQLFETLASELLRQNAPDVPIKPVMPQSLAQTLPPALVPEPIAATAAARAGNGGRGASIKLVVVGEPGVGKSCLAHHLGGGNEFESEYMPTAGPELLSQQKNLNGELVTLQVWDSSGEDLMENTRMCGVVLKGSAAAVVLYDITCRNTFESVARCMSLLQEHAEPDVAVMLVGHKADQAAMRAVSINEGRMLAESMRIPFAEVSSRTGTGLDRLLDTLLAGGRQGPDWSAAVPAVVREVSSRRPSLQPTTEIATQARADFLSKTSPLPEKFPENSPLISPMVPPKQPGRMGPPTTLSSRAAGLTGDRAVTGANAKAAQDALKERHERMAAENALNAKAAQERNERMAAENAFKERQERAAELDRQEAIQEQARQERAAEMQRQDAELQRQDREHHERAAERQAELQRQERVAEQELQEAERKADRVRQERSQERERLDWVAKKELQDRMAESVLKEREDRQQRLREGVSPVVSAGPGVMPSSAGRRVLPPSGGSSPAIREVEPMSSPLTQPPAREILNLNASARNPARPRDPIAQSEAGYASRTPERAALSNRLDSLANTHSSSFADNGGAFTALSRTMPSQLNQQASFENQPAAQPQPSAYGDVTGADPDSRLTHSRSASGKDMQRQITPLNDMGSMRAPGNDMQYPTNPGIDTPGQIGQGPGLVQRLTLSPKGGATPNQLRSPARPGTQRQTTPMPVPSPTSSPMAADVQPMAGPFPGMDDMGQRGVPERDSMAHTEPGRTMPRAPGFPSSLGARGGAAPGPGSATTSGYGGPGKPVVPSHMQQRGPPGQGLAPPGVARRPPGMGGPGPTASAGPTAGMGRPSGGPGMGRPGPTASAGPTAGGPPGGAQRSLGGTRLGSPPGPPQHSVPGQGMQMQASNPQAGRPSMGTARHAGQSPRRSGMGVPSPTGSTAGSAYGRR